MFLLPFSFAVYIFLLINGLIVQMSSAHMSTSGLDLHWPTIVVLWFILRMICHSSGSSLGSVYYMYIQRRGGLRGPCDIIKCFALSLLADRRCFLGVFGYAETELFRSQADGRCCVAVTAEVVL